MAIINFPKSNGLRFINRTAYKFHSVNDKADFNKRLYRDIDIKNATKLEYCQKYEQTDDVWFQVITDYPDFEFYLIDSSYNKTQLNGSVVKSFVDDNNNSLSIYEFNVNTTSLEGQYIVQLDATNVAGFPIVEFWSEPFEVKPECKGTHLTSWLGNRTYDDGMNWSGRKMNIRIESAIYDVRTLGEKSTYKDTETDLNTTASFPEQTYSLVIESMPFWIYEKINLGLKHDEFYLDGYGMNTSEAPELDEIKRTLNYQGTIEIQRKDYENYKAFEQIEGEVPVVESLPLEVDNIDNILYDATNELNASGLVNRIYQSEAGTITDDTYLALDSNRYSNTRKIKASTLRNIPKNVNIKEGYFSNVTFPSYDVKVFADRNIMYGHIRVSGSGLSNITPYIRFRNVEIHAISGVTNTGVDVDIDNLTTQYTVRFVQTLDGGGTIKINGNVKKVIANDIYGNAVSYIQLTGFESMQVQNNIIIDIFFDFTFITNRFLYG